MRKTISKLLCMVTVLAVVLTMMPAAMVSAAYTERLPGVTVHLLGDSTVASYETSSSGITGWGQGLEALLSDYVEVNNWAIDGLSTNGLLKSLGFAKEYAYEEQWTTILKNIEAGDYVFIQFGHNDQKTSSTDEIDVAVEAEIPVYKENLAKIITDTNAKGATPILVTPPEKQGYASAQTSTLAGYPEAMIEVANANSVSYIDLNSYSKTALAGKTADELTAYYAVDDTTHFSAEGALDLAKYIASQLSTAAPALAAYVKTDYESVATSAISYGMTYLRMNFQNATTKDRETGTYIDGEYYKGSIGAETNVDISTGMYKDGTVNKAMFYKCAKGRANYSNFDYNDEEMTQPLICYDFSLKLPTGGKKASAFSIRNDADKKIEASIVVYSYADGTIDIQIPCATDKTLTFENVEDLNYGEWNKIRVILDQTNEKFHLIANEKIVCTDIPYNTASAGSSKNTRYIFFGTPEAITDNEIYYDDVYIKTISERQAVKMLLRAADTYLDDIVLQTKSDKTDGKIRGELYLPSSAATTATSFVYTQREVGGNQTGLSGTAAFNITNDKFSTIENEPYYKLDLSNLVAAVGYDSGNDSFIQYKPTITVGSTTVNSLYTASLTIKRKLMLDRDDDIEISVPMMFGDSYSVAPNGTNKGWSTLYEKINAATAPEGANSAIGVNNIGNTDRKLIVALCFYENGKLAEVSSPKIVTIPKGGFSGLDWYTKATDVSEIGTVAKLFVFDGKTLVPLMNSITVE